MAFLLTKTKISWLAVLFLIIAAFSCYLFVTRDAWIKLDFSGSSYVANGNLEITFRENDQLILTLTEKDFAWHDIYLNKHSAHNKEWGLYFWNCIFTNATSQTTQSTGTLRILFDGPPQRGSTTTSFWSGPKLIWEFWSPQHHKIKFTKGVLTFDAVELKIGGKLTGNFNFSNNKNQISGSFDFILKKPPPIIPAFH